MSSPKYGYDHSPSSPRRGGLEPTKATEPIQRPTFGRATTASEFNGRGVRAIPDGKGGFQAAWDPSLGAAEPSAHDLLPSVNLDTESGGLSREERERRIGLFCFDLSEAFSKFDDVERRTGRMLLRCSRDTALMSGGASGEHIIHRAAEGRNEWLKRITTHWTGYLENNGATLAGDPEVDETR